MPDARLSAVELAAQFGVPLAALEAFGLHQRSEPGPDDHPSTMGARAVQHALDAAGLTIDDVGLLIFAGMTRDFPLPWVGAFGVLHELGARQTAGLDIGNRCASVHDGLWLAAKLVESGAHQRVAVVCADRFDHLHDPQQATRSPSDVAYSAGAAAAIVDATADNAIVAYAGYANPDPSTHVQNVPIHGGTRRQITADVVASGAHKKRSALNLDQTRKLVGYLREADARNIPAVARAAGFEEIDFVIASPLDVRAQLASLADLGIAPTKTFFLLSRLGHLGPADSLINLGVALATRDVGTRIVMSTRTVTYSNAIAVRATGARLTIATSGAGVTQAEIDQCR